MSGRVHVRGDASAAAGATGAWRAASDRRQRRRALRHQHERDRHRRRRQCRAHERLHGAGRHADGAGRCRRKSRRQHLRSAALRARPRREPGRRLHREADGRRTIARRWPTGSSAAGFARRRSRRVPPLRIGAAALSFPCRQRGANIDGRRRAPRRARAPRSTARRWRRSAAPRPPASTTSAASAPNARCRISTTCCSSAPA